MNTIFETNITGFDIKLEQDYYGKFYVVYGDMVTNCDTYEQAAKELGLSIMHALACEGTLLDTCEA